MIEAAVRDGDLDFLLSRRCQEACRKFGWDLAGLIRQAVTKKPGS